MTSNKMKPTDTLFFIYYTNDLERFLVNGTGSEIAKYDCIDEMEALMRFYEDYEDSHFLALCKQDFYKRKK